jgi:hypothetical protein
MDGAILFFPFTSETVGKSKLRGLVSFKNAIAFFLFPTFF